MAISYVGAADGSTSCTPPTHQAGDVFLVQVFRDGSNSLPTVPAGWTTIDTNTTNSAGGVVAYKIAASSSETVSGFTNGTNLVLLVYRGCDANAPIGGHADATGSSTTVSYPALVMDNTDGTSWVVGLASHRSVDTTLENAPTGMTNRRDRLDAGDETAGHDTNGTVSAWSLQTVSVGGTSSGWYGATVELVVSRPKIETLTDNFNDNSIDGAKWTTTITGSATLAEQNQQLEYDLPAAATASDYAGLISLRTYTLLASGLYGQITEVPNPATAADGVLIFNCDASNYVRWVFEQGTLYAQYRKNGGAITTQFSVAYNASTHKWWRITESGGTVSWDTSTDGISWTNRATFVHTMPILARGFAQIECYAYQVETSPGGFTFDYFNTPATTTTTKTQTGVARIQKSVARTATGVARILVTVARTIAGKARITKTVPQTITGKSRITTSTQRTATGKARITSTTLRTVTGLARITVSTLRTVTGIARVVIATSQTIPGVARITATIARTVFGKARLLVTVLRTVTGIARITITGPQTIVGKSRITVTTVRTVSGKARVVATVSRITAGTARIVTNTLRTVTGLARVSTTATRTILGTARIVTPISIPSIGIVLNDPVTDGVLGSGSDVEMILSGNTNSNILNDNTQATLDGNSAATIENRVT